MLLGTDFTIAYKCTLCGAYELANISLFKISGDKEEFCKCSCKKSGIRILYVPKCYELAVPCAECGDTHFLRLARKDVLSGNTLSFRCPNTNLEYCFVGRGDLVREKIDNKQREMDKLINSFGYDDYFDNTYVMHESINKIHEIAEAGNLVCSCGNTNIIMTLLPDRICLLCPDCLSEKTIFASSISNLCDIRVSKQILISDMG